VQKRKACEKKRDKYREKLAARKRAQEEQLAQELAREVEELEREQEVDWLIQVQETQLDHAMSDHEVPAWFEKTPTQRDEFFVIKKIDQVFQRRIRKQEAEIAWESWSDEPNG
jgi:hypothetical protein